MKTSPWHERHPTRAKWLMDTLGIVSPFQEVKCSRCGMVIKPEGEAITAHTGVFYSIHLGSKRCQVQAMLKKIVPQRYATAWIHKEVAAEMAKRNDRPFCACGCGEKVSFNARRDTWYKFCRSHHMSGSKTYYANKLALVKNGESQLDLRRKLGVSSEQASRIARKLEKFGFISRRRVLQDGRWTLALEVRT